MNPGVRLKLFAISLALVVGVGAALVGLAVPAVRVLYDYAWFVGFGTAFLIYIALMRNVPAPDLDRVPALPREPGRIKQGAQP